MSWAGWAQLIQPAVHSLMEHERVALPFTLPVITPDGNKIAFRLSWKRGGIDVKPIAMRHQLGGDYGPDSAFRQKYELQVSSDNEVTVVEVETGEVAFQ